MKKATLLCAIIALWSATCSAAVTVSTAVQEQKSAVALLKEMSTALEAGDGISYTAKISTSSLLGTATTLAFTATVEKSGKAMITLSPVANGIDSVYMDGTNVIEANSATSTYSTLPADGGFAGSLLDVIREAEVVFPNNIDAVSSMQQALMFPMTYSLNGFGPLDSSPGGSQKLYYANALLHGKPVQTVTVLEEYTAGLVIGTEYVVDPSTHLPLEVNKTVGAGGKIPFSSFNQSFKSFTLLSSPEAASAYAFVPPPNAVLATPAAMPESSSDQDNATLLKTGALAPNFSVLAPSGSSVKLSDFSGKIVVIDFWATWCGPCQESLPITDKVAQLYQPKGVVFLPICSWDTRSAFKSWLESHKNFIMRFYYDPAGEADKNIAVTDYGVQGIPTQYVIGKDGKVIQSFVGYDPNEIGLKKALDTAVAAP